MRFTAFLSAAAFAGVSFAATTASSTSGQPGDGCSAQNVLLACLSTQSATMALCATLDYACMCKTQAYVLQCYDQCPNDVNRSTEESKLTAYCVAYSATAAVEASTTATYSVESTAAASQTETGDDSAPTETSASSTDDGSSSPSSTKSSKGSATATDTADSGAAKITWMCASSLLAVLTAAFMAL